MLETVASIGLPVGEKLEIKRNRFVPQDPKGRLNRISIVSGTHGDELEGQYVCYEIMRRIQAEPEKLRGIVDVYPALNPLGIDTRQRNIPKVDMDMNRIFPGSSEGTTMERVAAAIVDSIIGSDVCVDVHASDVFVREIPQVRISEDFSESLLEYAKLLNADMIWVNSTATVHESTLAHSLNIMGVPTMVVELGLGTRISRTFGNQLVKGIFNLMYEKGIWAEQPKGIHAPAISTDGEVEFIRAKCDGVFLPNIEHNHYVIRGDKLGEIVNSFTGEIVQEIVADRAGLVFTLREYPIVYEGALLARILTNKS